VPSSAVTSVGATRPGPTRACSSGRAKTAGSRGPNRWRRIGADPVVAFASGSTGWFMGLDYDFPAPRPGYHSIKVAMSEDGGKTWKPPVAVAELGNDKSGKGVIDKPWLAVDRGDGKRRGTLYVAWTKLDFDNRRSELWCAAVAPGTRKASPAAQLGEPIGFRDGSNLIHHVQLAVRPDGTLDAVWRVAPSNRLVYAVSSDGAKTFSKPEPISDDETAGAGQFPSLAVTSAGNLALAWAERGDVRCSVRASGRWSAPRPLAGELAAGVRLSHPAIAATADTLWVLAYRWENKPERVSVVLHRSTDQGKKWEEYCTVASREFPDGKARQFSPGDYVGLTAAKGRVYAGYVLPGEGREGPRPRLYVSTVGVVQ
jgi:hypothetical protein